MVHAVRTEALIFDNHAACTSMPAWRTVSEVCVESSNSKVFIRIGLREGTRAVGLVSGVSTIFHWMHPFRHTTLKNWGEIMLPAYKFQNRNLCHCCCTCTTLTYFRIVRLMPLGPGTADRALNYPSIPSMIHYYPIGMVNTEGGGVLRQLMFWWTWSVRLTYFTCMACDAAAGIAVHLVSNCKLVCPEFHVRNRCWT